MFVVVLVLVVGVVVVVLVVVVVQQLSLFLDKFIRMTFPHELPAFLQKESKVVLCGVD